MLTSDRILFATDLEDVLMDFDQNTPYSDEEILAFYIAYSKFCNPQSSSSWLNWLNLLPETFSSILFFSEEELEYLKGSYLYEKAQQFRSKVDNVYVNPILKTFEENKKKFGKQFSLSQWRWAMAVVQSRKIKFRDVSKKPFYTIIPYFDFVEHQDFEDDQIWFGYKASNKFFHAEASKDFKKGERIYTSYGALSNGQLLFDRGIILTENRHDLVIINRLLFNVDVQDDELATLKNQLLKDFFDKQGESAAFITMKGPSMNFLVASRIASANSQRYLLEKDYLKSKQSPEDEAAVASFVVKLLRNILSQYVSTLKDDLERSVTQLTERSRMAFEVAQKEKVMLHLVGNFYAQQIEKEDHNNNKNNKNNDKREL